MPSYADMAKKAAGTLDVEEPHADLKSPSQRPKNNAQTGIDSRKIEGTTPRRASPRRASPRRVSNAVKSSLMQQNQGNIGSKIMGLAQESQLLKNMDDLSGGLLGTALASVAVVAFIAQATAEVVKRNVPESIKGIDSHSI